MDVLRTLNLDDLPEQQTRTNALTYTQPNFNLQLGFDACCVCGKPDASIECEACHRVNYCSIECRGKDSEPSMDDDEQALGHTAVICTLLSSCNDDEAVEGGDMLSLDTDRRSAAMDRVASEFESYPATLANVVMDAPCYQDTLLKRAGSSLTFHVIGASIDSELWEGHPDKSQQDNVFQSYAEALAEISEKYRLDTINLCFIGPDCPQVDSEVQVEIPPVLKPKQKCVLKTTTLRAQYSKAILQRSSLPEPDLVVFFNPGFTCPDYSWYDALNSIKRGIPCLVTTNTELEGIADAEFLMESGFISELPPGLAVLLYGEGPDKMESTDNDSFFSVNPYSGNRVRQSGTMANDIFVKNRWIFGGILGRGSTGKNESQVSKRARVDGFGNNKMDNPALI